MKSLLRSRGPLAATLPVRGIAWISQGLAIAVSFTAAFGMTVTLLRWAPLKPVIEQSQSLSAGAISELPDSPPPSSAPAFEFTLTAFGDSGWARSHQRISRYQQGFRQAYLQFDPKQQVLGDLNYLNWETSVGIQCDQFWAPLTQKTFAFVSHPQELRDAIGLGFNLIGLANNHSFDCLRSPEGKGPSQTLKHLRDLQKTSPQPFILSGVYTTGQFQPAAQQITLPGGQIPVLFISAYIGGDNTYCRQVICAYQLPRYQSLLKQHQGLRVLALHSWDPTSHTQLKRILKRSLQQGLIDIGIGTGPHIAERIEVISTPRGQGIYASSLGNFIHPSLMAQSNNLVLSSRWSYQPEQQKLALQSVANITVSCTPGACRAGRRQLLWSLQPTSVRP